MAEQKDKGKKQLLLRLSPSLWRELAAWAEDDFRSVNGQIEFLLTECVRKRKGRVPDEPETIPANRTGPEYIMIPTSTIVDFWIGTAATLVAPIVLLIVLCIRKRINVIPLAAGFASFFVSQILLRLPLLKLAGAQPWFASFAAHTMIYSLVLAFTAGLFEESGRLCGGTLLKHHRAYKDVISFGLGHGLCEVIVIAGLTYLNNALLAASFNTGGALSAKLSAEASAQLMATYTSMSFPLILAGLLERVSAVLFHLFATVLVFTGIVRHKIGWYFLAIGAHTAFDFMGVLAVPLGIWPTEILLFAVGLLCLLFVLRSRPKFAVKRPEGPLPSAL